jgi:hypothetical protein
MGISSLNIDRRISALKKRITTVDSSKCASRQDTQCAMVKIGGGVTAGVKLTKVCLKGKLTAKFLSTVENVE